MDASAIPKIISVDDHVVEPAHVWQDRLPAKFEDRGPKIVIAPQPIASISETSCPATAKYDCKTCIQPLVIDKSVEVMSANLESSRC